MNLQEIKFEPSDENIHVPIELWKKATHGDSIAQLELGVIFFNSDATASNRSKTFDWIYRSAKQGNLEAQFRLGDLYALGWGTTQCHTSAYDWYTKAAIQGYKKALIRIHNLYQEDLRIHCRGKLNSKESRDFGTTKARDLKEFRLIKFKSILNRALDYYTNQLQKNRTSNQQDPDMQQNLGFLYQHGYGVKKYPSVAIIYYTKAAEKGLVGAQYNLGLLYQQNTNIKFNYRSAFHWYTLAANNGNIAAQHSLAYFYEKGLATEIDYQKALQWYTRAANAGHSEAQLTLGTWYRKGQCINEDVVQAVKWYNLAAKQGNQVAQNCLDLLHQNGKMVIVTNIDEGRVPEYSTEASRKSRLCSKLRYDIEKMDVSSSKVKWFQKLAINAFRGDGNAMFKIGLEYYDGIYFFQDKDTSFKWIRNAANANCKEAQLKIAEMYKQGDITKQDYYKTSIWIKKVAKSKDDVGQYNLGLLYKQGLGVRRDKLEASKWFIFSSDQKNSGAIYELGRMNYLGNPFDKNIKASVNWYHQSAIRGNKDACYILGRMYLDGSPVKQDTNRGLGLLRYAARNGNTSAQFILGELYQEGKYVTQDQSKAVEYYSMISNVDNLSNVFDRIFKCLNTETVHHGRKSAYDLFKRAAEKNSDLKENVYRLCIQYRPNTSYYELVDLLTKVAKQSINNIEYSIGYIYEYGIYSVTMEETFERNYKSAIQWYSTSATKGDSRAQYRLGIMYEVGKGVEKNTAVAIDYYNKSAENNNPDAKYRLACMYLVGYHVPQDIIKAFYLFTDAANTNHVRSYHTLMLQKNTGNSDSIQDSFNQDAHIIITEEDQFRMFETMAEQGLVAVQYQLGQIYQKKGDEAAVKWLTLAAQGGISDASYRLGVIYEKGTYGEKDYSRAIMLYTIAAESGHEYAMYHLAMMYQYGKGTDINYIKAYDLYFQASEKGHSLAFKRLNITGALFKNPTGITKENRFDIMSEEFKQSILLCEYVAEQGNVELQYKMGTVYEDHLLEPNYSKAFQWYKMASSNSHREATYRLGFFYENGLYISQDYKKALQLYEKAKYLNSSDAIFRLAIAYHYGHGIDADPLKALEHYNLAASLGNPLSQLELGKLYQKGELVPQNSIEALKWYTKSYLEGYDPARTILYDLYNDDAPYEKIFYTKLYKILESIATTGSGFNLNNSRTRLGYWYYQNKDFEKAWTYFFISSGELHFLKSKIIPQEEKMELLNEFEKNEELLEESNKNILCDLGMVYYHGMHEDEDVGSENKKRQKGIVIEQDYTRSLFFLKKAAEKDSIQAKYQLGFMYQNGFGVKKSKKSKKKAQLWYSKVTRSENSVYTYKVGIQYHCDGPLQDFSKALENYRVSQEGGSNVALGILHQYGCGVEKSNEKALGYYKKGFSYIRFFHLAFVYYNAQDDIQDYNRAFRLFQQVVKGNPDSRLKEIFARPKNDIEDGETREKYSFTLEPENVFHGEAYYYLGAMYKNGQGTAQDEVKAKECFQKAIEYGNEKAKDYF